MTIARRATAEFIGTAFLLAGIVGSGISAERLFVGEPGSQLLVNALATAAVLLVAIHAFGPISGAHLNPAVTLADARFGGLSARDAAAYVLAQVTGAGFGTLAAGLMFRDVPAWSKTVRTDAPIWLGEGVATFGLVLVIFAAVRSGRANVVPLVVSAYIFSAFFFTSSTSFANPAVTIARTFTDSFTGIAPASAPGFVLAQLAGTGLAVGVITVLVPRVEEVADRVVLPHGGDDSREALDRPAVAATGSLEETPA